MCGDRHRVDGCGVGLGSGKFLAVERGRKRTSGFWLKQMGQTYTHTKREEREMVGLNLEAVVEPGGGCRSKEPAIQVLNLCQIPV